MTLFRYKKTYLNSPAFTFMLIENQLKELPLNRLFELMRIKIEEIKLLRHIADHKELLEVVDDIMLIQKVVDEKKFGNRNHPATSRLN